MMPQNYICICRSQCDIGVNITNNDLPEQTEENKENNNLSKSDDINSKTEIETDNTVFEESQEERDASRKESEDVGKYEGMEKELVLKGCLL